MVLPRRVCRHCRKIMRAYTGATGLGLCYGCHRLHTQNSWRPIHEDDASLAEIEARYQASMAELKRTRRLEMDMTWHSSLTRLVRG